MRVLTILSFSILTFLESGFLTVDCQNQIKLVSHRKKANKIEFAIEVKTTNQFTAVLYLNDNGALSEVKKVNGVGFTVLEFSEDDPGEGRYRVTVNFNDESKITCRTRSIELE
jgi:hypothetical protein